MISLLRALIQEALEEEIVVRQPLNIPIPTDLQDIHSRMKYAGRELFLVGGAVRDTLMGKTPKDYDVATNASPEEVIKILRKDSSLRLDLTGKQFGVVRVKTRDDGEYEIATFREDIGKGKGTSVKFSTIENDVQRRDLTINALFYDMDSGEVVDYVGGIEDIENGVIRAVGEPAQRFDEDRIRILRAVRFAARMGSELDTATKQAILEDNKLIDTETNTPIPAERISEEFVKGIKSAESVNHFLSLNQELGLFSQIFPGLQVEFTAGDTNNHVVQIAAILRNNPVELIVPALKKMKYSNNEVKAVRFLVNFGNITPSLAPVLKKDFKRLNIPLEDVEKYATITGTPSDAIVRAFLEFADAPPAADAKELMAQGLRGPDIGQAQATAEVEAYSSLIGELRIFIRSLLVEQEEIKFAGILKLMPTPGIVTQAEQIIQTLPTETEIPWWDEIDISNPEISCRVDEEGKTMCETKPIPADKLHVTLAHRSILKPFRKAIEALDLNNLVDNKGQPINPPDIQLDPRWEERTDPVTQRRSFVAWVVDQAAVGRYLNQVMSLIIGGPMNIWEIESPPRRFHVSLANLTGNPGDSVR